MYNLRRYISPWNNVCESLGWQECVYPAAVVHSTLVQFITSAIIKSHNRIQANILYKQTCSQGLHQRNLMIFETFRNAVTRYTHCGQCNIKILHWPQCVYLVNIPEPVQYKIYALALPFDLRCESVTYIYTYIYIPNLVPRYALYPFSCLPSFSKLDHMFKFHSSFCNCEKQGENESFCKVVLCGWYNKASLHS